MRADGRIVLAGLSGVLLLSDDGGRSFELHQRSDRRGTAALVELAPDLLLAVGEGGLSQISGDSLQPTTKVLVNAR